LSLCALVVMLSIGRHAAAVAPSSDSFATNATAPLHLLLLLAVGAGLYFLPFIVASTRHVKAEGGVFVINLFLGWTVLGWIIALAWAAGGEVHPKPATA